MKMIPYIRTAVLSAALAVVAGLPAVMPSPVLFKCVLMAFYGVAFLLIIYKKVPLDWLLEPLDQLSTDRTWIWPGAGLAILIALLTYFEITQPAYFTQDDSHAQFLPVMTQALRGLFSEGVFPTWNPYLYFGFPTASHAIYGLTYPVTYVSYFISRHVLGSDLYLIEVFAWLHLVAGFMLAYLLLRVAQVRGPIAMTGALCFALLGFNLIQGRGWYFILPYITWFPAFMWSLLHAAQAPRLSGRWVVLTGLAIGLSFHASNAQFWLYCIFFWALGLLWVMAVSGKPFLHFLMGCCAAGLWGLAVASPLLIVQVFEYLPVRNNRSDAGIGPALNSFILPYPLTGPPNFHFASLYSDTMGAIFHFGTVFFLLFLAACAYYLAYIARRPGFSRPLLLALLFPLLAYFAIWMGLGDQGKLWMWVGEYYPFNNARNPFKMLMFIALLCILAGGVFFERFIRHLRLPALVYGGFCAIGMACILVNAIAGKWPVSFYSDRPYPELTEPLKSLVEVPDDFSKKTLRVLPFGAHRSEEKLYTHSLMHNYPAYYHVFSTSGYGKTVASSRPNERLNQFRQDNFETFLKEFGIKAVLISGIKELRESKRWNDKELVEIFTMPTREVRLGRDTLYFLELPGIKPMAYLEKEGRVEPLPLRVVANGIEIKIKDENERFLPVTANFLFRDWFNAYAEDGSPLPINGDEFGRISVENTSHSALIRILYQPRWDYGFWVMALLALLASLSWCWGRNLKI